MFEKSLDLLKSVEVEMSSKEAIDYLGNEKLKDITPDMAIKYLDSKIRRFSGLCYNVYSEETKSNPNGGYTLKETDNNDNYSLKNMSLRVYDALLDNIDSESKSSLILSMAIKKLGDTFNEDYVYKVVKKLYDYVTKNKDR